MNERLQGRITSINRTRLRIAVLLDEGGYTVADLEDLDDLEVGDTVEGELPRTAKPSGAPREPDGRCACT
ncbi:MAG: hypothetical protein IPG88_26365 [Gemmatimonadetes bacterium]|nr:hypothetical protein [Gemmatimonadota bacterium]